jgi:hypothetical protein
MEFLSPIEALGITTIVAGLFLINLRCRQVPLWPSHAAW